MTVAVDQLRMDLDQLSGRLNYMGEQHDALRMIVTGLALLTLISTGTLIGYALANRAETFSAATAE